MRQHQRYIRKVHSSLQIVAMRCIQSEVIWLIMVVYVLAASQKEKRQYYIFVGQKKLTNIGIKINIIIKGVI
uniref:Uncharacterized protein n=1 Tax=virus sp. ctmTa7 TaxID=2828255 RepID=A0A8S5RD22_9VIRU|nr:MAG TPA: hypothetical protein [virus sp. ctmTa7]